MFDRIKKYKYRRYKKCNIIPSAAVDKYSSVGEYTYIGDYSIITKAQIGRYCSIGPLVTVGLGEHDINKISTSSDFYEGDVYEQLTKEDIIIGNDVWIGTKATILRGVKIGDGVVIGANAVVTKNIPDFAVVVGIPAQIIKFRFSEEEIKLIKNSQWWDKDILDAREIQKKLKLCFSKYNSY